jgi:hypothetical protein
MTVDASVVSLSPLGSRYSQRKLKYKLLSLWTLGLALVFTGQTVLAEEANSQEEEVAEVALSDSERAPADGFSVRESAGAGKKSEWSSSANAGFNRYLDELAVTTWTVGGTIGYSLSERDSLSVTASYSAPTELETATPEYYGVSDTEIAWVRKNIWKHEQWGSVSSSVKWRIPTSELSQRYTQLSSFTGALSLSKRMPVQSALRDLTLSASAAIAFTPHQYDRRAIGTLNSPFGITYGAGGSYSLLKKLSLSTNYSMYHRFEYDGYMQRIQTLSAGAVWTLPESLSLAGGYQWRDSVLTNDPFLDADKTLAYLELSRAF